MFKIITLFHYMRENVSLLEMFRVQKNSSRAVLSRAESTGWPP